MSQLFIRKISRIFHTSNGWYVCLRADDINNRLTAPYLQDGEAVYAGPFKTRVQLESWFDFYKATHRDNRSEADAIPDATTLPDFSRSLVLDENRQVASTPAVDTDGKTSQQDNEANPGLATATVLIIDDSHSFRSLAGAMLKKLGAKAVRQASTLGAGLNQIYGNSNQLDSKIDIILMDINLPDGNGIQGCEFVAHFHPSKKIPVVAISGSCTPEIINKALTAGAKDFLRKPFSSGQLAKRLNRQLDFSNWQ